MRHRLDVELDFITDLSPLELASKVAPLDRPSKKRSNIRFQSESCSVCICNNDTIFPNIATKPAS